MFLSEFGPPTSITEFNGLWNKGLADTCPPDHSPNCQNVGFNKKGEVYTRDGISPSLATGNTARMFLATLSVGNFLLTCDGSNIKSNGGSLGIAASDFAAINVFDKVLIMPIRSGFDPSNAIYIWDGVSSPRLAAGAPPPALGSTFTATEIDATGLLPDPLNPGNIDIGVHKFAVSFITDTGFTTPPGPCDIMLAGPTAAGPAKISDPATFTPAFYTASGDLAVELTNIPIGPVGTVARQIYATQADQEEYFYVADGFIDDNVSTTLILNFYDTDLVVTADPLFDLLTALPSAVFAGGLAKYHGRTFIIGENDLVRASNPGDCESYDNVAGYIQIPSENDGNSTRGACILNDILYFTKGVGIFSVTDNGGVPSGWAITVVDGGCGSFYNGIETITGSQSALAVNNTILLSDLGGLYAFTGTVQTPALTWKVEDIWRTAISTSPNSVTVTVDPFKQIIYALLPGNLLLVGDYSDGLNSQAIKWTKFTFPISPISVSMINFNDGFDFFYTLRIGTGAGIYKLVPGATSDNSVTAINSFYYSAFIAKHLGSWNVFRHLRARIVGVGNTILTLLSEDSTNPINPPYWTLTAAPGKEFDRQINYKNEKMSVGVGVNHVGDYFILQRLDVYSTIQEQMRPS